MTFITEINLDNIVKTSPSLKYHFVSLCYDFTIYGQHTTLFL